MRLLSLAVVAGLFAAGVGFAADEPKAEKKAGKVTGVLTKVDGDKLVVTIKSDAGEKEVTFTTTDKTKFFVEEAVPVKDAPKEGDKPAEKKPEAEKPVEKIPEEAKPADKKPEEAKTVEKKPEEPKKEKKPAAKRTEVKMADLKTGSRVAVRAGEDKVAVEVVQLPAKPKKAEPKPDAPKEGEKPVEKK